MTAQNGNLPSDEYEYLIPLGRAADVAEVGRKAANLHIAKRLGLPVPDGLVLSAKAMDEVVRMNPEATVRTASLPPAVAGAVVTAARTFERAPHGVVVRSSSALEDGLERSFAGQFESVFCPSGDPAALEDAVRTVWASSFAPAVQDYEKAGGHSEVGRVPRMAVLIQKAISPWASGVLAAEPGGAGRLLIEGTWGLPVPIVQGLISPDVLTATTAGNVEVRVGERYVCVVPLTSEQTGQLMPGDWLDVDLGPRSHGRWKVVWREPSGVLAYVQPPEELQCERWLRAEDEKELRAIAIRLAEHFPTALDVEWARDRDGYHLLQVRPLAGGMPVDTGRAQLGDIQQASDDGLLVGRAAAPGKAVGHAWVSPRDGGPVNEEISDGGVLVCTGLTTDLVPALLKAAAVVSDEAGVLAHTAIVARELGKPCVVDIPGGITHLIKVGDPLEVDGDLGTVRLVDDTGTVTAAGPRTAVAQETIDEFPRALLVLASHATQVRCGEDPALWSRLAADSRWDQLGVLVPAGEDVDQSPISRQLRDLAWRVTPVTDGGQIYWICPATESPLTLEQSRPGVWTVSPSDDQERAPREFAVVTEPPQPIVAENRKVTP